MKYDLNALLTLKAGKNDFQERLDAVSGILSVKDVFAAYSFIHDETPAADMADGLLGVLPPMPMEAQIALTEAVMDGVKPVRERYAEKFYESVGLMFVTHSNIRDNRYTREIFKELNEDLRAVVPLIAEMTYAVCDARLEKNALKPAL